MPLSSVLESILGDLVGRMMSRELRMYAEQGNSSNIAEGGSRSGCILQTLREQSSDVGQGKRECAENSEQGSIINNGFRFQFQVQNELHMIKVT